MDAEAIEEREGVGEGAEPRDGSDDRRGVGPAGQLLQGRIAFLAVIAIHDAEGLGTERVGGEAAKVDAPPLLIYEADAEVSGGLLGQEPQGGRTLEQILGALVRQEAASDIVFLKQGREALSVDRMIGLGRVP